MPSRASATDRSLAQVLALALLASLIFAAGELSPQPASADDGGDLAAAKEHFGHLYPEAHYLYLPGTVAAVDFVSNAPNWDWGIFNEVRFPYRYWEVCGGILRWAVLHPTLGWRASHEAPTGYFITLPPNYSSNAGYQQLRDFHQADPMPTWPFLGYTPFHSDQDPEYIAEASAARRNNQTFYVAILERQSCEEPPPAADVAASFEYTVSGTVPGQVVFESSSTHSEGDFLTHEWDLGDGAVSSTTHFTHVYELPGEYEVTLRVVDPDGVEDTTTQVVEVPAPPLSVVLDLPDGATVSLGSPFEVELRLMAPVSIGGLATVGDLTSVAPIGDEVLRLPEGFEVVEAPSVPEGGLVLEPGAGPTTLTWTVQADVQGNFTLRSTWEARDAAGREVGPVEAEFNGGVAGLDVEVEVRYARPPEGSDADVGPPGFQKDNNGDGVIDAADHRVEVVVTATNRTHVTLQGVGPIADDDRVVRFSNHLLGDGQVSLQPIEQPHQMSFGDLEPGEPVERTYVYEAIGQVHAEVRAMLEGVPELGGVVRGVGTAAVQLAADLAVEVEIARENRAYTSGDTVRLVGAVRNLLADVVDESGQVIEEAPEIAVVMWPFVDGNAGNGHISAAGGSSMTPIAQEPILLAPEEEVDISAILLTQRTEQPSEARVRYRVRAWEITEDGEPAVEIDQSRIVVSEEGAFSAEHATELAAYDFTPDDVRECVTVVIDDIVSCNLYVGIRTLALGLWDLATLIPVGLGEAANATSRTASWAMHMNRNAILGVVGDPVAQQAIMTEIEVQLATFRELGIMTHDGTMTVAVALTEFLDEAEKVIESGDGEAILAFFSRQAGENLDMTIGGLTKLRVLTIIQRSNADAASRTVAANATREARERAAREAQESIEQRVRESRARGDDPSRDGTFRGNEDVTDLPLVTRGVYGTDAKTLGNVASIAQAENVLIGWRGRSPIVAELYRLGQIYLKPMDIKAKTVNVIDVHYFGYRRSSMGKVELTEPPIDYRLAAPGNEAAFNNALDNHMATLRSRHPEIANDPLWAAEVRKRLEHRTKEYPKQLREFQRYHYEGIKLEFGYDQQGLPSTHTAEVAEMRNARVKSVISQGDDGVTRRYLELEMDGPGNNGAFRQVGGDTDLVLIQNPDRTPLTDPVKRRRIYEALQEQIGLQHGETMTYINPEVQAKLLRDHVAGRPGAEALLIGGPDGRVRTGYLEEIFSSRLGPDGEPIGSIFNLVSGAPAELLSSATIGQAVTFPGYLQRLDAYVSSLSFYLPGRLAHLAAGLEPEQLFPAFDLSGLLLQPDGKGGVVVYDPEGGADGQADTEVAPLPEGDDPVGALLNELVAEASDAGLLPDGPPEVGAAGGRWIPIDVDDILKDDGRVVLAPMTSLSQDVAAGDTYLPINDAEAMGMAEDGHWFEPGDRIVLDPGGHNEEFATVAALGSLVLTAPLTNSHEAGTAILRITASGHGGNAGGVGTGEDAGGDRDADAGDGATDRDGTDSPDTDGAVSDTDLAVDAPDEDVSDGAVSDTNLGAPDGARTDETGLAQTGLNLPRLVSLALVLLIAGLFATRMPGHGRLAPSHRFRQRMRRW